MEGREEIGAAVGAEEFVVFDEGGGADAGGRQRIVDADDARGEADADGVGEGDVRREGEGDLELGPRGEGAVEVEENASRADILSLSTDFIGSFGMGAFEIGGS